MSQVEVSKTKNPKNMHAMVLTILGAILLIAGIAIITIHNPLRGSGAGTAFIVLGVLLAIFGVLRFISKRPK
jgi:hypothetical protein